MGFYGHLRLPSILAYRSFADFLFDESDTEKVRKVRVRESISSESETIARREGRLSP